MRKKLFVFGILILAMAAARSGDTGLDTDLMQAIEDSNKSLSSNIALKDGAAAISDSKELNGMFDKVQLFFTQKGGADDAVDLAKKSKALTEDIVKEVNNKDFDTASQSATTLSRTCRTCHTFYKKE